MKKALRCQLVYIMLVVLFIVAVFMNINTGNVHISFGRIFKIIFLKAEAGTAGFNIIWKIRLPRLLSAAILGGALALSGFLLQTFFRNPIAGPFVLGISSGAKNVSCNYYDFSIKIYSINAFMGSGSGSICRFGFIIALCSAFCWQG